MAQLPCPHCAPAGPWVKKARIALLALVVAFFWILFERAEPREWRLQLEYFE